MDVPALSFSFIGIYFFVKYYYKNNFKHLIYFGLSFLICGLLKVSSLVSFIALFGVFILESLGVWRSEISKIFPSGLKAWLVFSVVFSLIIIWYLYAYDYNRRHTGSIFLVGILPAWNMDKNQLANAFQSLWNQIRTDYFLFETQLVWAAMLLYSCIFYRKGSRKLQIFTLVMLAGVLGYVVLFFQAVSGHDYYVLNMLVAAPVIILCFLKTFQRQYKHIYYSFIFRIILVIFLIHNIDFATRRLHDRYNINGWQNENYIKNVRVFEEISPYLETIGVARDDKVISLSDNSINITLYLMNRKGWTNYGISGDCAKIREKIGLGAKFIIVYNQQTFENPAIQEFLYNEIGVYKTVHIYKL
jgi:hypothetical protein